LGILLGVTATRLGAVGKVAYSRSAEPDFEVEARLPCLLKRRREEARMDDVVEMLKV
jgi:adenosine deaminase